MSPFTCDEVSYLAGTPRVCAECASSADCDSGNECRFGRCIADTTDQGTDDGFGCDDGACAEACPQLCSIIAGLPGCCESGGACALDPNGERGDGGFCR